ncbi:MAG: histidine kinase [Deltaproteobacteria bacterium]|nr:histidine kinase [Deltaproteobacteria bacterium]
MSETLFEELKRYVGFDAADEAALRGAHPLLAPHFKAVAETFYDRILTHDEARKALEGGESMVGRLKITLVAWMDYLLQGPWDEKYYETRARIGRVHVRIALPQHYMLGAMNVVRREFNDLLERHQPDAAQRVAARRSINKMLDIELAIMLHTYREDLLAQQARVERLSTFGQLVGSIGHELRNPLGVIESSLFILKKQVGEDPKAQKHMTRIGEQLDIASHIISDLLDMIRDRPLQRERVELAQVLRDAAGAVNLGAKPLHFVNLESLAAVPGDPVQLRQVFVNLIENASQALGETGEVFVEGTREDGRFQVAVEDTGPGVPANVRARLFEPLVTTKARGIGLGLALVKRIVERHGGTIVYAPRERGARFVVTLPSA